jgi:fructuronate reductase
MKPERIVHLGLGNFHRAHQAWYTHHASDSADWGIVAYTGRSPATAETLTSQRCQYTLITRDSSGDTYERITSIVRAESGDNLTDLIHTMLHQPIALVTLTITEAGYQVPEEADPSEYALGRLAIALNERRLAGLPPLAMVSCDNMPRNGEVLQASLKRAGRVYGEDFIAYLAQHSFVSTSVDRITPQTTTEDISTIAGTRWADPAPVVTEPFSSWILSGDFPLGRPDWESAGASYVHDLDPFENRKLWMLNGAHTILATFGMLAGYATVNDAIGDPSVLDTVNSWWDDASIVLPEGLDLAEYRDQLLRRFSNPHLVYRLDQIAQETLTKLRVRIMPVVVELLDRGIVSRSAASAIASYVHILRQGGAVTDSHHKLLEEARQAAQPDQALLALLSPQLATHPLFREAVVASVAWLSHASAARH